MPVSRPAATAVVDHRSPDRASAGYTSGMEKLIARVRNGRLMLDAPTDLPDGTEIELEPVEDLDLTPDERAALDAAIDDSVAQAARGEVVSGDEALRRLRARRG